MKWHRNQGLKLQENIQRNSILVTALVPQLGYDKAAEIAKEAMSSNKTIKEVLLDSNLFLAMK